MGALYDAAVRALREPSSERQAQAWKRQDYFFEHQEELEHKRANGAGSDSITAQRRERGNGYLHVRDWSELDCFAFRSASTRPFAAVMLSLIAFKKLHAVQGSHEGLAEMMGVFGRLCSAGTIRNVVGELVPLGLLVEPYYDHHPEGFRCRRDRRDDEDDEQRRLREWVEASPLYSLAPGGTLGGFVDRVQSRRGAVNNSPSSFSLVSRLPTDRNLSGSGFSSQKKKSQQIDRDHLPCGNVDNSPAAHAAVGKDQNQTEQKKKVRPSAAIDLTARLIAAPEKAAMTGRAAPLPPPSPSSHAKPSALASVPLSPAPVPAPTPAPVEAPQAAPAAPAPVQPSADIVRELLALALTDDSPARSARLAELEALADRAAAAATLVPTVASSPAALAPPELLTPLQERKRHAVVLSLVRAQRDAARLPLPAPPSPPELARLGSEEIDADAHQRSRGRVARPSDRKASPIADALTTTIAALQRRKPGGYSAAEERAAVVAIERQRRRAQLDEIGASIDALQLAMARALLPRSRVELIDRAVGNVVALFQRGQLDVEAVLANLSIHRRSLAELRRAGDAGPTLERLDESARQRALVDVRDD